LPGAVVLGVAPGALEGVGARGKRVGVDNRDADCDAREGIPAALNGDGILHAVVEPEPLDEVL